jgi:SAUR family protein
MKSHSKITYKQLNMKSEKAKTNQVSRKGHVALYVGKEKKRYEVPVKYLLHPSIQKLIIKSQHGDLETKIDGPIELECKAQFFDDLLILVKEYYRSEAPRLFQRCLDFFC